MDQAIRNTLRNVVTQCRKLLEEAVSQVLQGQFGIHASGKKDEVHVEDEARMKNLSEEDRGYRQDILAHLEHIEALGYKPQDALAQLVREIAFTHLNRLCAYKMMEAREVWIGGQRFREAVSRGLNSQGFQFYLADHTEDKKRFDSGHQDVAYRHFLAWLGALLSEEIGVLFSPTDPANRLLPPQRVLDDVLALLNCDDLKDIWSQDETIGWVYQYFTPKELRDQARKESQAPRNSYELAFRNQFFTPRYVVEFLTDNTLGRIWYEMRKGDTRLKDQCRHLVRRPSEVFLAEGKSPPKPTRNQEELSQEELLKQPVHIPHRPKKDPRELRILDPACGSGHFLLYCFDLLLTIYEEAYADPDLGSKLKEDYPTLEALRRDVPRLILAHNLHGIDIDLRCAQIAALALWLRCQRAYREMGLKQDRPRITKSNIVCAEPMPGEEHILNEFVGQIEPKLLGQLVEVVFAKMKLAGEAGSLLRIEEEIRDTVAEARKQWLAGPVSIQRTLFDSDQPVAKQQQFDFSGITDAQFFEQAEAKVVEALREYAEQAQNGKQLQRRLFAEDAVQGFALVDICHKRFDVVLMNPPFGLPTERAFKYLEIVSPPTYVEIYASFVERALNCLSNGLIGAITSRSFTTMSRLTEWRRTSIVNRLDILLDLGLGVMDDAAVESCAYVLSRAAVPQPVLVLDLRSLINKQDLCLSLNWAKNNKDTSNSLFAVDRQRFLSTNQHRLLYRLSADIHALLRSSESFEPAGGLVRTGLTTFDDFRFLRLRWEVAPTSIGKRVYWEPFSKGGERVKYHSDVHLLVNRRNDGEELAEANIRCNGQIAQSRQGSSCYYKPGLTFTSRCSSFSVRALPEGCVISHNAPTIYGHTNDDTLYLLGWVNSRLIRALVEIQANKEYYVPGSVKTLPWKEPNREMRDVVRDAAIRLYDEYKSLTTSDETTAFFSGRKWGSSIIATFDQEKTHHGQAILCIQNLQHVVSESVDQLYGVDSARFSDDIVGSDPDDEVIAESPTIRDLTAEAVSFCVGCVFGRWSAADVEDANDSSPLNSLPVCSPMMLKTASCDQPATADKVPESYPLRINWDGIIPDDPDHSDDILRRVREVLEVIWKDRTEAIEREACEILGVKELRDYVRKPGKCGFWDDHVARYSKSRRKAPIYWLLQSSKKNYGLWLYYHRLDKDILFKALLNYVEPKIRLEQSRLDTLRVQKSGLGDAAKEAKKIARDVDRQEALLGEIKEFEEKLRRVANLDFGKNLDSSVIYDPDLNDGVVLNIAPLWELVPWKEAKSYWDELLAGEYEWSSMSKLLRKKGLVK
jgi:hypothetical protein